MRSSGYCSFFFFNDTATTEIYTLSLHDALPISTAFDGRSDYRDFIRSGIPAGGIFAGAEVVKTPARSEEHTSELQSHVNLVCRLLLEKKKLLRRSLRSASSPRMRSTSDCRL